jgi:TonB family protein
MKYSTRSSAIVAIGLLLLYFSASVALATEDQAIIDRTTRDASLNTYALITRDCIQQAWTTPIKLWTANALKGKVRIDYTITRSGLLESVEMVKGSGRPEMDQSLLAAIKAAAPYPAFPEEINASRVVIRANFIIADLPTVSPTRVSQVLPPVNGEEVGKPSVPVKKYQWGIPAKASDKAEEKSDLGAATIVSDDEHAPNVGKRPTTGKFQWGAH